MTTYQARPLATWRLDVDQTADGVRHLAVRPYTAHRGGVRPSAIVVQTIEGESGREVWKALHTSDWAVNVLIDENGEIRTLVEDRHAPLLKGEITHVTPRGRDMIVNCGPNVDLHSLSVGILRTADGISDAQIEAAALVVEAWIGAHDIDEANVVSHGDLNAEDGGACACNDVRDMLLVESENN